MATEADLDFTLGDDPNVSFTVDTAAYSLANKRVEFVFKANATDADAAALFTLSSAGVSPKVTIVSEPNGTGTFDLSDRLTAGAVWFYRGYVAASSDATSGRRTFVYGKVTVNAR